MKESELIKKQMAEDDSDNDQRDMNWLRKLERAERKEKFQDKFLTQIKELYQVIGEETHYTIITDNYGALDYYPKANSLLIRRQNKWIKPGLKWIINNLLK